MNSSNNKKEFRRKAILNDALLPLLVKTSIPTIIGMLVMVIYNLTDTFFVGVLNNKSMTAAIGLVLTTDVNILKTVLVVLICLGVFWG